MSITTSDEILTLTAVMAPGKKCSGHFDVIPGGMAYEDQNGWLWCLACAKHMTGCTDEDCDHPAAVFSEPDLAALTCGESNGTSVCAVRPGNHDPASNCPGGPVLHVAADGSAWTGPMGAGEAAMATLATEL